MYTVELITLIEKMNLEVLTPDIDYKHIKICQPELNRPALQLAGFFDYFDSDRVQIIGRVEEAYMRKMEKDRGIGILTRLMDYKIPCIVFCRSIEVQPELIQLATEKAYLF
jgi:HPr kinase/phosphorylase